MRKRSPEEDDHDRKIRDGLDRDGYPVKGSYDPSPQGGASSPQGGGVIAGLIVLGILGWGLSKFDAEESNIQQHSEDLFGEASGLEWKIPKKIPEPETNDSHVVIPPRSTRALSTSIVSEPEANDSHVVIPPRSTRALNTSKVDENLFTDSVVYEGLRGTVNLEYGYEEWKCVIKGTYKNTSGKQWATTFIKVRVYDKDESQIGVFSFWPPNRPTSVGEEFEIEGEFVVLGKPGMPPKIEIE